MVDSVHLFTLTSIVRLYSTVLSLSCLSLTLPVKLRIAIVLHDINLLYLTFMYPQNIDKLVKIDI